MYSAEYSNPGIFQSRNREIDLYIDKSSLADNHIDKKLLIKVLLARACGFALEHCQPCCHMGVVPLQQDVANIVVVMVLVMVVLEQLHIFRARCVESCVNAMATGLTMKVRAQMQCLIGIHNAMSWTASQISDHQSIGWFFTNEHECDEEMIAIGAYMANI